MDLFDRDDDFNQIRSIPGLLLGTQGWSYSSWVGSFYPKRCKPNRFIEEYSSHFPTVEIDSTFYAIPSPSVVDRWRRLTPDDFIFSAKFPQVITHEKRLVDCGRETKAFLDAMSVMESKLGALLLQFDYLFRHQEIETLSRYLSLLPSEFKVAVEIRHPNWLKEDFFHLLEDHSAAFVLAEQIHMPRVERVTSDLVYIRWLGDRKQVTDDQYQRVVLDKTRELGAWATLVKGFLNKRLRVFGYFNNHYMGHSPASVRIFHGLVRDENPSRPAL